MHKALAIIIAMSLFTGCKKKGGADEAVAKVEGFATEMCACKDKACADGVNDKMKKWSDEHAKSGAEADPDLAKKITPATMKLANCYTKQASVGAAPDDKKPDDSKAGGW
jgi:hypothetical protein